MLLNIAQIINNQGASLQFDNTVDIDNSLFDNGIRFSEPVSIKGEVKNIGGVIVLTADIAGKYVSKCDRCLTDVNESILFSIKENFVSDESLVDEEEAELLVNNEINVSDVVFKSLYSYLPTKHLCSAECKGICQQCGANLNDGQCDCIQDDWNPQFDILKDLFK